MCRQNYYNIPDELRKLYPNIDIEKLYEFFKQAVENFISQNVNESSKIIAYYRENDKSLNRKDFAERKKALSDYHFYTNLHEETLAKNILVNCLKGESNDFTFTDIKSGAVSIEVHVTGLNKTIFPNGKFDPSVKLKAELLAKEPIVSFSLRKITTLKTIETKNKGDMEKLRDLESNDPYVEEYSENLKRIFPEYDIDKLKELFDKITKNLLLNTLRTANAKFKDILEKHIASNHSNDKLVAGKNYSVDCSAFAKQTRLTTLAIQLLGHYLEDGPTFAYLDEHSYKKEQCHIAIAGNCLLRKDLLDKFRLDKNGISEAQSMDFDAINSDELTISVIFTVINGEKGELSILKEVQLADEDDEAKIKSQLLDLKLPTEALEKIVNSQPTGYRKSALGYYENKENNSLYAATKVWLDKNNADKSIKECKKEIVIKICLITEALTRPIRTQLL